MSVPDHRAVVEQLFRTGHYNLKTHDGLAAFADAAVLALHAHDSNWGHVIKRGTQTNIHGHGEDSALYKLPNNMAHAVDFIEGARGDNPKPGWGPDPVAYYKHSDWLDPVDHDGPASPPPAPPPPPAVLEFPPRDYVGEFFVLLDAKYMAGRRPNRALGGEDLYVDNEGIFVWLSEYIRHYVQGTGTVQERHKRAVDAVFDEIGSRV